MTLKNFSGKFTNKCRQFQTKSVLMLWDEPLCTSEEGNTLHLQIPSSLPLEPQRTLFILQYYAVLGCEV